MIESEHANLTPQKGRVCQARTNEIPNVVVKGGEFHPNGISVAKQTRGHSAIGIIRLLAFIR
jgi:hypothetical protein